MNELQTSVETYLDLVTLTYEESPPRGPPEVGEDDAAVAPASEVDGLQVLIDTHINNLAGYSTRVIDLRSNNIETFRSIDRALNPVVRIASQVQAAPPGPASGGFRLNPDLRPHILQKYCTLKEATTFSESFANYMTSSPNSIIPEGQLWDHINSTG